MSRNGSGVYTLNTAGQPVVAGTVITATAFNSATADIATALTQSICYDGQTTTTGLIPFALGLKTDTLSPYTALGPISLSAGQLQFPASQNASTNANTLDDYEEGTWTPTVTLVGGAGNTVPVYSTNSGRYTKIGNRAFCEVQLNGDGGAEGAGTGQVNVSLPVASSASITNFGTKVPVGGALNSTSEYMVYGFIGPSVSVITLSYPTAFSPPTMTDFAGSDQSNTTRSIHLVFSYETAS